jgi:O-antigen biosynthesis protein
MKTLNKESEKKVAIVIATYNQGKLLEKCISSLKKTSYKNYKIYLVDDSGNGNIGKEIKKRFKEVSVMINSENLGCSKSYNRGMKESIREYNPDYVILLNDDIEFTDTQWLSKTISAGEKDERIGILGCKMLYPDKSLQWVAKNGRIHSFMKSGYFGKAEEFSKNQKVGDIIGACFIIKRKVIEEIGMWDEKFSPYYGEETDYCFRAAKKGFYFVYVGNTEIIHHGASSTKGLFNEKVWFIKKRNAIRLEWLNHSFPSIIKYTFIHFGSAILSRNPIKKLRKVIKAYKENIKNYKEIKAKRKERNSWKKI